MPRNAAAQWFYTSGSQRPVPSKVGAATSGKEISLARRRDDGARSPSFAPQRAIGARCGDRRATKIPVRRRRAGQGSSRADFAVMGAQFRARLEHGFAGLASICCRSRSCARRSSAMKSWCGRRAARWRRCVATQASPASSSSSPIRTGLSSAASARANSPKGRQGSRCSPAPPGRRGRPARTQSARCWRSASRSR